MTKLHAGVKKFIEGDSGATMVEYGLMLGLIALVCFSAVQALGLGVLGLIPPTISAAL